PVMASRSPMSPMPQLVVRGHENSGITMPDRRRPAASVMTLGGDLKVSQDAVDAFGEAVRERQQAHDEIRLSRKIEKESRMRQHTLLHHEIDDESFLAGKGGHLKDRVPPAVCLQGVTRGHRLNAFRQF